MVQIVNAFKIKKYGAYMFLSIFPITMFTILQMYSSFWIANLIILPIIILCGLVANKLLYNPFTAMLEGKGLLTLLWDSTGLIYPFISRLEAPYIHGKIWGKTTQGVFDRKLVFQMTAPVISNSPAIITEKGIIKYELNKNQFADSKFAMLQYPVLVYNEQLSSYMTKDMLSTMEKDTFAEYTILYMNRKTEELTAVLRDFSRGVIELLKPKGSIGKWLIWLLSIGIIVILGILFIPQIIEYFSGTTESIRSAAETTSQVVNING